MGITLTKLKEDLASIREKRREVIGTGQSYNITGSHSVTQQTLKELRAEESRLIRQIRRYQGIPSRSKPDFSSTSENSLDNYE